MNMESLTFFVIFYLINIISASPPIVPNSHCDIYKTIVPVDAPNFRYTTYFMELEQCQGADSSPITTNRVCKPTKVKNMNITVFHGTGMKIVSVPKHEACSFDCKDDASICNKFQTWDEDTCSCTCPSTQPVCDNNKEWRRHDCNCVCSQGQRSRCLRLSKEIDSNTCECIPTGRSHDELCSGSLAIEYVVIIMVIELVVLVAIVLVLYRKFVYKSNGEKPETVRLKRVSETEEVSAKDVV